jgi:hypothetical protein
MAAHHHAATGLRAETYARVAPGRNEGALDWWDPGEDMGGRGAVSELKPGEYVGADGKLWRVLGVFAEEVGKLYGADAIADAGHPDFPAAVEALTALVPEPFEWESDGFHYRLRNGVIEWQDSGTWRATSGYTDAFEAGRRYERERGHADE